MNHNLIVDTSIWIEYFRENPEIVEILDEKLDGGKAFIVGPVITELLHGVKTKKEYDTLLNCIDAVPYYQSDIFDWKTAGNIGFSLRKKGLTIPVTDLIIAAIAINRNAIIYTRDKYFDQIPGINLFTDNFKAS